MERDACTYGVRSSDWPARSAASVTVWPGPVRSGPAMVRVPFNLMHAPLMQFIPSFLDPNSASLKRTTMSPSSMKTNDWLIEQLEKEKATFDEETCPLLSWQIDSFAACCDLLREDAVSLEKRSKQRRSERLRARAFLVDVFLAVGSEVFLLCVFAVPISKLEKISPKDTIPKLRTWWKTTSHPPGLTATAMKLCGANSIRTLISSYLKRKFSEISTDAGIGIRSYF